MRSSLFLFHTLIFALPISADGLLPKNLPANWKAVDAPKSESGTRELGCEIRMNTDDGDILLACRYALDDENANIAIEQSTELARMALQKWWPPESTENVVNLRARESVLSSVRKSNSREDVDRGNVTKYPVVLTTFVLEADTGNLMANGLSFKKDGQTYVFHHVSTKPITDKIVSRFAIWALRHAKLDDAETPIEP